MLKQPALSLYDVIENFTKHDGIAPVVALGISVGAVVVLGDVTVESFSVCLTVVCTVVKLFLLVVNSCVLDVVFGVVSLGLGCV